MQSPRRRLLLLLVLALPLISAISVTDPRQATQPAAQAPPAVLRIYDARDLLDPCLGFFMADAPRAAGFAKGPVGDPEAAAPGNTLFCGDGTSNDLPVKRQNTGPTREELVERLIHDVESAIDTDSWRDNGGMAGMITEDRGNLLVTQTAENQTRVKDFLDQMSQRMSQSVRVEADWVWISPTDAAKLFKVSKEAVDPTLREIDPAALASLPASVRHVHAEISGRNGQMVYIASGRTRAVVSNVTPVVSTGVAAFAPTVSPVAGGVGLQVQPMVKPDLGFAVLHLYATFDDLGPSQPAAAAAVAGGGFDAATTRPSAAPPATRPASTSSVLSPFQTIGMTIQDVRTTVRVPLDRPVVVASGTWDPTSPARDGSSQTFLIVSVHALK